MNGSSTERFFSQLAERGHDRLLEKADGTIHFQLLDGDRGRDPVEWTVTIDHGDIAVSNDRPQVPATCSVRCPAGIFERITEGRANATAAVLRGELVVEGDPRVLLLFQRAFPGPDAEHPVVPARRREGAR